MSQGCTFTEHAPLAPLNTLRVAATAPLLAEVFDPDALPALLALPRTRAGVLVLGEGSNVLLTRDPPGVVVRLRHEAIDPLPGGRVRAGAGANWHRFVRWTLERGYCGLENLALIPGTVGAAPVQNIGAYGVELAEFVHAVRAYDRHQRAWAELPGRACGFGYRDSVFKREPERYVVTEVEFALPRSRPPRLDYAGVREELAAMGIASPTPTDVADAVERLRRRKLPDPAELGNAGSFFKNPVVPAAAAEALRARHGAMPSWPGGAGMAKLSAAWLIERCGFKGAREGDAGIAPGHALVLVNHGSATGAQLWALAQRVQQAVEREFGVRLEPEPRVI